MTLREGLLWLMGAGAGVIAFYLLDRLEHSTRLTPSWFLTIRNWYILLGAEDRRWTAFGLTGILAVLAYLFTLMMGYSAPPGPWRAWVEELFTVVASAIVASQVAHGRVALRRSDIYRREA